MSGLEYVGFSSNLNNSFIQENEITTTERMDSFINKLEGVETQEENARNYVEDNYARSLDVDVRVSNLLDYNTMDRESAKFYNKNDVGTTLAVYGPGDKITNNDFGVTFPRVENYARFSTVTVDLGNASYLTKVLFTEHDKVIKAPSFPGIEFDHLEAKAYGYITCDSLFDYNANFYIGVEDGDVFVQNVASGHLKSAKGVTVCYLAPLSWDVGKTLTPGGRVDFYLGWGGGTSINTRILDAKICVIIYPVGVRRK